MGNIISGILVSLLKKLLTERFISITAVNLLRELSKKTSNTLDDKIVEGVADALGVKK